MCSYCGCNAITTIGRLMDEHVDVVNATGLLRRACEASDAAAVTQHADIVARMLAPHYDAEEVGLFAVMKEATEYGDYIDGLCVEHETLDGLLARVTGGEYSLVTAFEDALRSHIDKEDNGLFPGAAVSLTGPDWERVVALEAPIVGAGTAASACDHAHPHDPDHRHDHHHPHDPS